MEQEEVLGVFRETGALLDGHFELRSGLHSPAFFQCAKVLCYPRLAEALCVELVSRIRTEMGDDFVVDSVIGPAMGGIAVGHEVAKALDVRSIFAEKENDKLVLRRFDIKEGERIVIAEDVITRGGRVQEVIDIVEGRGGIVAGIALLVDRSGGKVTFNYPQFSLLQIEPVTYDPQNCPLCEKGLELVHPGS